VESATPNTYPIYANLWTDSNLPDASGGIGGTCALRGTSNEIAVYSNTLLENAVDSSISHEPFYSIPNPFPPLRGLPEVRSRSFPDLSAINYESDALRRSLGTHNLHNLCSASSPVSPTFTPDRSYSSGSDSLNHTINTARVNSWRDRIDRDMNQRHQDLKIRPPKFTGKKGEQIKQFFSRFEKYIQHHQVPQANRVNCLGLMLENDALEFYDSLLANDGNITYDVVKDSLILRFDDDRIRLVIRSNLHNRKLKAGETITEYYSEMHKEGAKIGISDEDFLFTFLNGLPQNIKQHVALREPADAAEAFKEAKNFEQIKLLEDTNDDAKTLIDNLRVELAKENKASAASLSTDKRELKEVKDTLQQLQESIKNLEINRSTNMAGSAPATHASTPWAPDMPAHLTGGAHWPRRRTPPFSDQYNDWYSYARPPPRSNFRQDTSNTYSGPRNNRAFGYDIFGTRRHTHRQLPESLPRFMMRTS